MEHSKALTFQLQATMRQGGMAAIALADRNGLLMAWAGEDELCEELGAAAPLVAHGGPPSLPGPGIKKDDVSVRAIELFGEQIYVASLGGGVARDALLAHAARGVQRILTAN